MTISGDWTQPPTDVRDGGSAVACTAALKSGGAEANPIDTASATHSARLGNG